MRPTRNRSSGTLFAKTALFLAVVLMCDTFSCAQPLDLVIVTPSRVVQRGFDTPAAIQLVDHTMIESGGPQINLSESLNRIPGLTILNRQNYAQDLQVSIRGFGARSAFGIRGIRLLVDGIPATTPDGQGQGSSISLTSTDRIEVFRGPLAQIYGNSAGGVIQAFTRDAPKQPEFGVQYYVGSFGMHRTDWQYAGRVSNYGLVADYSTFDTNGYRDNSKTERKQFNGKLSFDVGEKTRVNVVLNHFDMPLAQDPVGLTVAQVVANPVQAGNNAVSRSARKVVLQNQMGSSLIHTIDADRSVTANLYYGKRNNLQFQTSGVSGGWVGLNRIYYGTGLQYNEQTQIGDKPLTWVFGYEFARSSELRQGGDAVLGMKTTTTRNEGNQAENSDFFVQASSLISEQVSLVTGLRYSAIRLTSTDYYLSDGNGSGSVSFQASSPVMGLTYHATDSLNLYANYGKGFESPTLAEVAYNGAGVPSFNTSVNASSSRHYELGAKWLLSQQSRLDFTLFQIDTTDEIVIASSNNGSSTYKNAPGTTRTGWELSDSTLLTPHVRVTLAASKIDATFEKTFTSGASTVASGNKLPGIPQHFLYSELLWTGLKMDGSNKKGADLGIQAGIELTQAGRLYANDTNTASANGYSTLNLKASHGWAVGTGNLTAYARIDNLTGERYVGSVIVNQALFQFYEPAPGRNFTLGLRLILLL